MGIELPFVDQWPKAAMQFCERTLDTYPKHPADTWSNIGPLIAGIWIVLRARRNERSAPVRAIGYAAIATAICSGLFHASNTAVGEVLDIAGMYAFVFACASVQAFRNSWLSARQGIFLVLFLTTVSTALASVSNFAKTPLFAIVMIVVAAIEINDDRVKSYQQAIWGIGWLVIAFAFWILDYTKTLCDPDNHILTGHGIWHLLNGLTFYHAYRQFAGSFDPDEVVEAEDY